ncbi:MAG: zf-HC2 domain-containing protein [Burkholderiaceae bacterium]|jgi:hypothetical protein
MSLIRTCKEMHRLVAESLDRPLSPIQRLQMRLHLSFCDACTNFKHQMMWLREAMRRFDEH